MKFILAYNEQSKKLSLIDGFYDNEEDIKTAIVNDIKTQFPEDLSEIKISFDDKIKIRTDNVIQHLPLQFTTKYGLFCITYTIQPLDGYTYNLTTGDILIERE